MGTDIHLRVQRSGVTIKNLLTGEEKLRTWVDVDNMEAFEPDPTRVWLDAFDAELAKYKPADAPADFRLLPEEHRACCDAAERAKDALGDGDPTERNYLLFARLFDVRNGRGFAGCETHRPIESLFAGRGLPDDDAARRFDPDSRDETSVWTDEELERSYLGDHSFTHATLAELLHTVADDTPPTGRPDVAVRLTGVVEEAAYLRWLETGAPPEEYCGDAWGTGHHTYDHDAHEAARAEWRTADVYDPTEPAADRPRGCTERRCNGPRHDPALPDPVGRVPPAGLRIRPVAARAAGPGDGRDVRRRQRARARGVRLVARRLTRRRDPCRRKGP